MSKFYRVAIHLCMACGVLTPVALTAGCGPKVTIDSAGTSNVKDINYLMSELDAPDPALQRKAMFWIRQLKPRDGEPALPKLQELAASSKYPNVKEAAQETIKYIQGG